MPSRSSICLLCTGLIVSSLGSPRARAAPPAELVVRSQPELESVPEELTLGAADGLTADAVAARAVANNFSVDAALASLQVATAVVTRARGAFVPQLVGVARAARLSQPPRPPGPSTLSVVTAPPGTVGPIVAATAPGSGAAPGTTPLTATPVDLAYRPLQTQYMLQGNLTVPLSDYFTRLAPLHRAALHGARAARRDLESASARSATEGRICYFEWLRARAMTVITIGAFNDARRHWDDVQNHMTAGLATLADLLQAQTAMQEAELSLARAQSDMAIAEQVVRSALRAPEEERIVPSDTLDAPPLAELATPTELVAQALRARPELKSAAENGAATRERARAARSPALPAISLSGNAYYGNPAPRQVLQRNAWAVGWDATVQLSWAAGEIWQARGAAAELGALARVLDARASQLAQTISLDTRRAAETLHARVKNVELAERMVTSATGAVSAARELFASNETNPELVLLAERDLTRARTTRLNAVADAWLARVLLDQALGRSH